MPNRVEGAAPGVQPATARPDAAGTAQRQPAAEAAGTTAGSTTQIDRVEISQAAQTRNREMQGANAAGAGDRGAALNAPGAQPPQAGEQGNVEQATQRNAEQLRQQEQEAQQQVPREQQQDAGNLVDFIG